MTDPASPRTRPTGVELAAMTDADFDAWVHAHSDTADHASPRSAESRDLRGDVDETPPIEPGHRPAPEVRETLRASMEAWYAAVAARDQKGSWRAANEMHVAIARFLAAPLPDDEVRQRLADCDDALTVAETAVTERDDEARRLRAIEAAAQAALDHGCAARHRFDLCPVMADLRAALASHPSEPPPDSGAEERLRAALERLADEMDDSDPMRGPGLGEFADRIRALSGGSVDEEAPQDSQEVEPG